jgi:phosphate transport system substrate-binding protein
MKLVLRVLLLSAVVLAMPGAPARAQQITGAGATFPYPIYAKWSEAYREHSGVKLNYQSIGSGGGIAQIKAGTVTFGASDAPLPPDQLRAAGLAQFPMVIGGVVPVVNLPGMKPSELRFTGALLAAIYLGKVKKWNDPAIAALNQGAALLDLDITVVHRSDGSGTTFNFVDYLAKVSPAWQAKVGEGTSVSWPTGIGGKGNEGVAAYIGRIKGSIGYVEYAYVLQNKMDYALVQNQAGRMVKPELASFQAAAASADWAHAQDFDLVMTNAPGPESYPITAASFILMPKHPKDAAASKAALGFFKWALEHGQPLAEQLGYVPLPDALVNQIEAYWQAEIH